MPVSDRARLGTMSEAEVKLGAAVQEGDLTQVDEIAGDAGDAGQTKIEEKIMQQRKAKHLQPRQYPDLEPGVYHAVELHPNFVKAVEDAADLGLEIHSKKAKVPCFVCGLKPHSRRLIVCASCDAPACPECVNFEPKVKLEDISEDWRCQICLAAALKTPPRVVSSSLPVSPAHVKKVQSGADPREVKEALHGTAQLTDGSLQQVRPAALLGGGGTSELSYYAHRSSLHPASQVGLSDLTKPFNSVTDPALDKAGAPVSWETQLSAEERDVVLAHRQQRRLQEAFKDHGTVTSMTNMPELPQTDGQARIAELESSLMQMSAELAALKPPALMLFNNFQGSQPQFGREYSQQSQNRFQYPMGSSSPNFASGGTHPGASRLFSVDPHRPSIFRAAKEVSMGFGRKLVHVEKQSEFKWTHPVTGVSEKVSSAAAIADIYSWTKDQYHQWCTESLSQFESDQDSEGVRQIISLMRELEEVAQITGDSWEVMHPYLVKRFGQLMDGASLPGGGAFLGTLDHSVLLQAQGSAKTKLDGDLQSRFAKLKGQVANMKQGDKPKPSSRPGFLTTAEYEVYKEWRTLHLSVCPKCSSTYPSNYRAGETDQRLAHYRKCVLGQN